MSTGAEHPDFIVGSRVRSYVSKHDLKLSEETLAAINQRVQQMIDRAMERTRANKRLTVRPHDL